MPLIFPLIITSLLFIFTSSCPNNDTYCIACNGTMCTSCGGGFLSNGVCQNSTTVVANCVSYSSNGFCRVCNLGFVLNPIGLCTIIGQSSCLSLDSTGAFCTSCSGQTLVNNGLCDLNVSCGIQNCLVCGYYQGSSVCGLCNHGFSLQYAGNSSFVCVNTTMSAVNCTVVDPLNSSLCRVCYYNSYFSNGTCVLSNDYHVVLYQAADLIPWKYLFFFSVFFFFSDSLFGQK